MNGQRKELLGIWMAVGELWLFATLDGSTLYKKGVEHSQSTAEYRDVGWANMDVNDLFWAGD